LQSLGPVRWQPWSAVDWSLPDANGRTVRLADYRGRPVVVIFYLGMGCVHCVEQLAKFGPLAKDFAAAGIDIVAIGTDSVEALKASATRGKLPFTVLADPGLATFRAYGAFDEFERMPLHATVLIDGTGRVRWQAVGAEPFGEVEFLLGEAKRLLRKK
jgi:peroxiredoxin